MSNESQDSQSESTQGSDRSAAKLESRIETDSQELTSPYLVKEMSQVEASYRRVMKIETQVWEADPILASRLFAAQARGYQYNMAESLHAIAEDHKEMHEDFGDGPECDGDCLVFLEELQEALVNLTPYIDRLVDTKCGPPVGLQRLKDWQEARVRIGALMTQRIEVILKEEGTCDCEEGER